MPSNVLLGCLKKNVMNSNPSSSSQSSCQGTQFVQVDKNLFQSLSIYIYIYIHICQRTRGKSVIDGLEQGIKKWLEQGIIQKVLKETETGKLINTAKLGATVRIRKLIGNGGYGMWGLEVFFSPGKG